MNDGSNKGLLQVAVDAAFAAGQEILRVYESDDFAVEQKADDSPLTRADRLAHGCIVSKLEQSCLPLLSEEGRSIPYDERRQWSRFWLVDPLDGTKEFISRNGDFTVNIALIEHGCPVLGVIYVPVHDELYFGIVGDGAYRILTASHHSGVEEYRIHAVRLPQKREDSIYRVVGSRSHMDERTLAFIESRRNEYPVMEIAQRGSSLKICMVASGEADVYPRFGPTMEWDTAAGHAIAVAAGKTVAVAETGHMLVYNKVNLLNPFFIVQ